jgi:hypothetical protein
MPNASGTSSRREREPTKPPGVRASRNAVAAPDTRNSSDMRHGELSRINGSIAADTNGDFTCQSQVT